eukprot:3806477-Pleurochrysis_carterae.AAC.4
MALGKEEREGNWGWVRGMERNIRDERQRMPDEDSDRHRISLCIYVQTWEGEGQEGVTPLVCLQKPEKACHRSKGKGERKKGNV